MYYETITQFKKMLKNFDGMMAKAAAYADSKKFDVNVLMNYRLAPDMFPFSRQVQITCDQAKFCASYLTGQPAPAHPDTEANWQELRERIQKTLAYLETVKEKDFASAASAKCAPKWAGGQYLNGDEYLTELAIPNFYFHLTTAYGLLRHAGVDLGKGDYTGSLNFKK